MNPRKKKLLYAFCGLCAVGAAASGWGLYRELKPRAEAEQFYAEVRSLAFPDGADKTRSGGRSGEADGAETAQPGTEPPRGEPDWEALRAWNPDICGWIYCPGTSIDYPVVQGADNDWYLNRTVDQKKSVVGSIFLESGNQADFGDDVSVLYGHHIRGGRMFTPVSEYKNQKFYEAHPVMYLYTPEADYRVELFASEILNGSTGSFPLRFADGTAREDWLEQFQAGRAFRGAALPGQEERILALCTCTYEYQDARYTVYGSLKKLDIDEDENEERRTHDEKESENRGADIEPSDAAANTGHDSAG